jgi:hypothetical protein
MERATVKQKLRVLAVITALAVVAIGAWAPAANAAVNPFNPFASCGFGYTIAKQENVIAYGDPVPAARYFLMYNPTIDTFCGVTIKSLYVGVATDTSASVSGLSNTTHTDLGPRLFVAGPVKDHPFSNELGRCVLYGASLTAPDGKSFFHETANPAIGFSLYCLP